MMFKPATYLSLTFLLFTLLGLVSCNKDKIDDNPSLSLEFSSDTVIFDTVFTSIGSITQRLLVYNNNKNKVNISSIQLGGGDQSFYKLNIDGTATSSISNIELEGNDSLYIFVKVTIDPNSQNTPFIVTDSIRFSTNGNLQDVKLVAWGQDAWFHKSESLQGNVTWDSLKPHVIYGFVRVDTAASLTIEPGCKVYFHKGAYMAVSHDASLKINGNLEHPIRFQGDRMDAFYRDLSGQWEGIYLERGSRENYIDYAIIKNGDFGISVDSISPPEPMLSIHNTIIQNVTGPGLYAYGSNVFSSNCVIGNCGSSALYLDYGGTYDFRQLTIGNYWASSVRTMPSLYISNYTFNDLGGKTTNPLVKAYFGNLILYGNEDEEILMDSAVGTVFNYTFDHAILKTRKTSGGPRFIECLYNKDPLFVDYATYNFAIDSASPAIKKGIPMGVLKDINGVDRGETPDLGAYQFVPLR